MPPYSLYDFLDHREINAISAGIACLEKTDRLKVNLRRAMLEAHGEDLPPKLLSDTSEPHIKKLRINGQVAVRLFLCKGPVNVGEEFTFLFITTERDNRTVDNNAAARAEERRKLVFSDPINKRCPYEKIC